MKVVVNRCFGGFGLSEEALDRLKELGSTVRAYDYSADGMRADGLLTRVVQELGDQANGRYAELEVVDVPDDVKWTIEEYDGQEWVSEVHRTW